MMHMKKQLTLIFIALFFFSAFPSFGSVSLCSWNLENFGSSKTEKTLQFIATTLQPFDVIAVIEVVAGDGGAQTVARLVDFMNRKGKSWDYCISNPTSTNGHKSERYAFIWNKSRINRVGNAWLEKQYQKEIEREPYMATFRKDGKEFTVGGFHAVPKKSNPEAEIKYFKFLPAEFPSLNLIFCGDFNCPQSNSVFNPLKSMHYLPALVNQKTTLRDKCLPGGCLASEYDNFFYNATKIKVLDAGVIPFYKQFPDNHEARKVSDHLPIILSFEVK
jgi:endonuclease/exonuclease/phosphatase family metal-dependent hydrolase